MACYVAIIRIEHYVVISRLPSQPMMCFLMTSEFQQHCPYQFVHHNVEECWGYQVPLGHSFFRSERPSIEPPLIWHHSLLIPKPL